MPGKIYLYILLILCEAWSQEIIGTLADEDIGESSNVLLRQKRVVNRMPGQNITTSIQVAPYIVIVRHNGRIQCVGSILSHRVVITIPQCVRFSTSAYQVISATSRTDRGNFHNVIDIRKKFAGSPSRSADGIALLIVNPPFVYGSNTSFIPLNSEPLLQGTLGTISGWGYNFRCNEREPRMPVTLRSIEVPIIAHRDCVNRYRPYEIVITDKNICTYHPLQHCGHTDGGAPLVIEGHLVGIHLFTGPFGIQNDPEYPEVFALLQDSTYKQWITRTMRDIEAQFQNQQK